ncbi:ATP dependent DNA ligase domain-containing protein [Neohortaea acidophila]|uniref:DNA ligase n=1 Tax=Neohortaea acidophila TaxID=245834 RepID=A0A6A6Q0T2_9PEZI|nr:ATP dependent DNA ligase domain-containing protein [Neohortaea acidophila]KAF2486088.1 ATP dependent DNA ligase domain-containing protein [Neohortaea acidophila]
MYGHGAMTEQELDDKYPNRPHNHSRTLLFSEIYLTLFHPLSENKKKPTGPAANRRKRGMHGGSTAPNDIRRSIIARFIDRWRRDVGNDIFPAFRLIVPEKDRDRAMYGLKESTLGKLLVRVMKIDKNSEDGYNLLHWKLPGVKSSSAMAGDFAGRCFEVISKRPMRTTPGDMTIAEVNELLDRLSVAQKEENQRPIVEEFYNRMNAEELMWLIRMILRQMKVGATEKTIFEIWHPDAENLFNISSSLRRVCWELYDPQVRLEGEDRGIHLMQCFQPQLAQFQMRSIEQMVARMNPTEDDPVFWIEEKLDGERMQLHMKEDDIPGGKRFGFWSRKAKDYTYLYGESFDDDNGALTRHLREAFNDGVRNIILDGEMITWDPKEDKVVAFGTLKSAAISEQENPYAGGNRPLFRVFDCLYLNGVDLTPYTLRKRREALTKSVNSIHRRIEVHDYKEAKEASEVEPALRRVVAESTEGLILKNPRSRYALNERNDNWMKVKPEYMTEFGEALDCVVIGGYYGSGKRGGGLSSFMCGLTIDDAIAPPGTNPQKCYSFFKVGGGFTAGDYAEIRHRTEGKWLDWDPKRPPTEFIELAGGDRQHEKPDVWIKPEDSIVLAVKAAQVAQSDQFKLGLTLRFPRFKKLRADKDWKSALSVQEFYRLKAQVEEERKEKQFKIDDARRKRSSKKRKREVVVQGQEDRVLETPYAGPTTKVFDGLSFFVMTEAIKPVKKTKAELEHLIKANGGNVVASEKDPDTVIIADRNLVKVASLQKRDERNLVRPSWILDCVKQAEIDIARLALLLPLEPEHLFYTTSEDAGKFDENVDEHGDSYAKDVDPAELRALFNLMQCAPEDQIDPAEIISQLHEHGHDLDGLQCLTFLGLTAYCEDVPAEIPRLLAFGAAKIAASLEDKAITHVVLPRNTARAKKLRAQLSSRKKGPRIVTSEWVSESWKAKTRLDEERFTPS